MRDIDIRSSLHNEFLAHFKQDGSSLVVDELKVCNGESIVDVAVINGSLHAYEIKSDADTLARLPGQVESYGKVFDYATIVVNGRYIDRVEKIIPDWWGVWLIVQLDNQVVKQEIRPARRNPCIDSFSVAQLLWRDEAMDLLTNLDLAKGLRNKRKWLLWQELADRVPVDLLCLHVRSYLKVRADWKISRFNSTNSAT